MGASATVRAVLFIGSVCDGTGDGAGCVCFEGEPMNQRRGRGTLVPQTPRHAAGMVGEAAATHRQKDIQNRGMTLSR